MAIFFIKTYLIKSRLFSFGCVTDPRERELRDKEQRNKQPFSDSRLIDKKKKGEISLAKGFASIKGFPFL